MNDLLCVAARSPARQFQTAFYATLTRCRSATPRQKWVVPSFSGMSAPRGERSFRSCGPCFALNLARDSAAPPHSVNALVNCCRSGTEVIRKGRTSNLPARGADEPTPPNLQTKASQSSPSPLSGPMHLAEATLPVEANAKRASMLFKVPRKEAAQTLAGKPRQPKMKNNALWRSFKQW